MSEFGESMAEVSLNLLNEFGQTLTLTRIENGPYNVEDGGSLQVETSIEVKALVEDTSTKDGKRLEAGLKVGTRKVTIAAKGLAFPPALGDLVKLEGDTYTVLLFKTVYAASSAVLYELQVSRN